MVIITALSEVLGSLTHKGPNNTSRLAQATKVIEWGSEGPLCGILERQLRVDSVEKLQNALASNSCEGVPQLTTHAVSPARID